MHTLAPPALPVNPARAIACGLCLVCTTLAPLPSHAFTYDVLAGSVIVQHQSTGTPLVWPTPWGVATFHLKTPQYGRHTLFLSRYPQNGGGNRHDDRTGRICTRPPLGQGGPW